MTLMLIATATVTLTSLALFALKWRQSRVIMTFHDRP